MTIHKEDIQTYLYNYVEQTTWQIETPQRGFSFGKRFIGIAPDRKVFVRLGVDPRIIQLLSDARLTPRYLAGGRFLGIDLTNQQQRERFYLYMSTRALYVSLFFVQAGHEHWAKRFLKDAQMALEQQTPSELLIS